MLRVTVNLLITDGHCNFAQGSAPEGLRGYVWLRNYLTFIMPERVVYYVLFVIIHSIYNRLYKSNQIQHFHSTKYPLVYTPTQRSGGNYHDHSMFHNPWNPQ